MSLLSEFTRCGSNSEFLQPIIGSAWTKLGIPVYAATDKWGNGVVSDNSNNQSKFIAVGLQTFSLTFSAKMLADSTVNSGFLYDVIGGYLSCVIAGGLLSIGVGNVLLYPKGSFYNNFQMAAWAANDILDMAIIFDATAAAGSKISVYQNGVDVGVAGSYTEYSSGDWSAPGVGVNMRLGYNVYDNVVIDIFKCWPFRIGLKDVLDARRSERAGMRDWQG